MIDSLTRGRLPLMMALKLPIDRRSKLPMIPWERMAITTQLYPTRGVTS